MKSQKSKNPTSVLAGRWRKLSHRVIVGTDVRARIPEPGLASMIAATRKYPDSTSLLLEIRRNSYIPSDIYPALGKIETSEGSERIPALTHISNVNHVPLETLSGIFQGKELSFICLGNSYEADAAGLVLLSPTLRSVPPKISPKPIELVNWLADNRDRICKECGRQSLSLVYLIQALQVKGKTPCGQNFNYLAGGRDLYDRSPTLQNIPEEILKDPIKVVAWLHKNQEAIQSEASESSALVTLVEALQAAQRIPYKQRFHRLAGSRDLYDRMPALHDGKDVWESFEEIIRFIDERREFFPKKDKEGGRIAYTSIIDALEAAGRIAPKATTRFLRFEAAAADYARRFEGMIKEKIRCAFRAYLQKSKKRSINLAKNKQWMRFIDRSEFLSIKTGNPLSRFYIRTILKWAIRLYGFKEILKILEASG